MEENGRDNLGRFRKGHIEDALTRKKRIESLKKSAKRNPNYLGELKKHPLYNIWRGFRFTDKGKKLEIVKNGTVLKNFMKMYYLNMKKEKDLIELTPINLIQ